METKDKNEKLIYIAAILLAAFFILPVISWGFSLGTILLLLIWFLYFKLRSSQQEIVKITTKQHIILLFVLAVISSLLTGFARSEKVPSVKKTETMEVSGDNITGKVNLKHYTNGRVKAEYFIIIKDSSIASNYACKPESICNEHTEYTYALDLVRESPGDEGMLSSIHCNKNIIPEDFDSSVYYGCDSPSDTTDTFLAEFTLSFESLDKFLQASTLNIHDGSEYWIIEDKTVTENETTMIHAVDLESAVTETEVYRSYTLSIN